MFKWSSWQPFTPGTPSPESQEALFQAQENLDDLGTTRTAELQEANHRLQMQDEFIAVISHELRTSLTSLHSALKILATGRLGHLSAEGQQMLGIANESTERLIRLVNNVLDLQRIESGSIRMERQWCNAAYLMDAATDVMQPLAQQHGVKLLTQTADLVLWVDEDYILQTLTNLLSNAIKFSSQGGRVWLTIAQEECQEPNAPSTKEAVFRVRDEGQGIPAEHLDRIFERFQQVDASNVRRKGGTGLGLAICRSIVEQHQGRIWADSTPGCGSTFTFTVPLFEAAIADQEGSCPPDAS